VAKGNQTILAWPEPAIFTNFGRHIFGTFIVEANIIMRASLFHRSNVVAPISLSNTILRDTSFASCRLFFSFVSHTLFCIFIRAQTKQASRMRELHFFMNTYDCTGR